MSQLWMGEISLSIRSDYLDVERWFHPSYFDEPLEVLGLSRRHVELQRRRVLAERLEQSWIGLHETYIRALYDVVDELKRDSSFPYFVWEHLMEYVSGSIRRSLRRCCFL